MRLRKSATETSRRRMGKGAAANRIHLSVEKMLESTRQHKHTGPELVPWLWQPDELAWLVLILQVLKQQKAVRIV